MIILRIKSSYSLYQCEKLVVCKSAKTNYGTYEILEAVKGEFAVAKTGSESFVAEKTAASVLKKLGCSAEDYVKTGCAPLKSVVEHRKDLFIVVFSADSVGDLVEIYAFVDKDHKTAVSDIPRERRPKL